MAVFFFMLSSYFVFLLFIEYGVLLGKAPAVLPGCLLAGSLPTLLSPFCLSEYPIAV